MQIWETTQGFGHLYVNNSYTTGAQSATSLKATVNGASGAVLVEGNWAADSNTGGSGEAKTQGMSAFMGNGELTDQRDFIPLETNSNHNSRAAGRGGGGGQQQGSGLPVPFKGVLDGYPNKRKRDNKASTFGLNSSSVIGGNDVYTGTPWKERNYPEGVVG